MRPSLRLASIALPFAVLSARLEVAGGQVPSPKPDGAPPSRQIGLTFTQLAGGNAHTCGVVSAGHAHCWGGNDRGQIGDGSGTDRVSPVAVGGGLTFTQLAAGRLHPCGLDSGRRAYCWGDNQIGRLGDGTAGSHRSSPVAVSGGLTFTQLAASGWHTCGLVRAGRPYCCGNDDNGELGDGSTTSRSSPVRVVGFP